MFARKCFSLFEVALNFAPLAKASVKAMTTNLLILPLFAFIVSVATSIEDEICGDITIDSVSLYDKEKLFISSGRYFWIFPNFTMTGLFPNSVVELNRQNAQIIGNHCAGWNKVDIAVWSELDFNSTRRCDSINEDNRKDLLLVTKTDTNIKTCILRIDEEGIASELNLPTYSRFKKVIAALELSHSSSPLTTIAYRKFSINGDNDNRLIVTNARKELSIWECKSYFWRTLVEKELISKFWELNNSTDFKAVYFHGQVNDKYFYDVVTNDDKVYGCSMVDDESNRDPEKIPIPCVVFSISLKDYFKIKINLPFCATTTTTTTKKSTLSNQKELWIFLFVVIALIAVLLLFICGFIIALCVMKKKEVSSLDLSNFT